MRQHLVIRREQYVAGTRERPEVGVFTQTHRRRPPVPWNRIGVGDVVWMRWSGGPIVARARVQGFRQIGDCSPERLRAATTGYGLHYRLEYWESLPLRFFAVAIYLQDEAWLSVPLELPARSYGESWIVLDTPALVEKWLGQTRSVPARHLVAEAPAAYAATSARRRIPAGLRFQALRRDDFQCTYCGRRPPAVVLHVDHVVPWSAGGPTVLDNLRTACSDCNLGKGARRLNAVC
jgi:HNH endonuclease